jgi:hypothetical protein
MDEIAVATFMTNADAARHVVELRRRAPSTLFKIRQLKPEEQTTKTPGGAK